MSRQRTAVVILAIGFLFAGVPVAVGDTEDTAFIYVAASSTDGTARRGGHYAKCIPGDARGNTGRTLIYKVGAERDELVDTYDWYSWDVHPLSTNEGTYVVRFAGGFRGHEPRAEDLAVGFYAHGKLIKAHSALDLVKDPAGVETSVSHYQWCRRLVGFGWLTSLQSKVLKFGFSVETVGKRVLCFDAKTGELLKGWQPERLPA
jgi:hypothetical protein